MAGYPCVILVCEEGMCYLLNYHIRDGLDDDTVVGKITDLSHGKDKKRVVVHM